MILDTLAGGRSSFVPVDGLETTGTVELDAATLDTLIAVPLSDTELHLSSHHFPICVFERNGLSAVAAIVTAQALGLPIIGANGRWSAGYRPIATRCFPFAIAAPSQTEPIKQIHIWQAAIAAPDAAPVFENAKLAKAIAGRWSALKALRDGQARLAAAADKLLLAGVMTPIREDHLSPALQSLLTVEPEKFMGLSPRTYAALGRTSFSAIDLAAAMIFSQRRLRRDLQPVPPKMTDPGRAGRSGESLPDLNASALSAAAAWIDDSDLFSIGDFDTFGTPDRAPSTK